MSNLSGILPFKKRKLLHAQTGKSFPHTWQRYQLMEAFMKEVMTTLGALSISFSVLADGASVCKNTEGSILYESSTKVGASLLVVEPRIWTTEGIARVGDSKDSANAICGTVSNGAYPAGEINKAEPIQNDAIKVIFLKADGQIESVKGGWDHSAIILLVCRK
jgi:hypothetical protein